MTTTYNEQTEFKKVVVDDGLLDSAVDWIKENLAADDVFDEDELVQWVEKNRDPDDVFTKEELREWAKDNGFVEKGLTTA